MHQVSPQGEFYRARCVIMNPKRRADHVCDKIPSYKSLAKENSNISERAFGKRLSHTDKKAPTLNHLHGTKVIMSLNGIIKIVESSCYIYVLALVIEWTM